MLLPIVETLIENGGNLEIVRCIQLRRKSGWTALKPINELDTRVLSCLNGSIVMALWRDDPVLTQETGEFFETALLCNSQQNALSRFIYS